MIALCVVMGICCGALTFCLCEFVMKRRLEKLSCEIKARKMELDFLKLFFEEFAKIGDEIKKAVEDEKGRD